MKQIIPFIKDLSFNTKISEVTSIALEHNLKMENNDSIIGEFIISGNYKINEISVNEEEFNHNVDFDITLDDKYDVTKVKIDIDDFYYEIINDSILRIHIDVMVDNLIYIKEEGLELSRENEKEKTIELPGEIEKEMEIIDMVSKNERNDDIKNRTMINDIIEDVTDKEITDELKTNLGSSFLNEDDKYTTYQVHIVRENETIETIKEKYSISIEELEKYNSLDNIVYGTKVIIPTISNE
ncbi:MAG: LysM peptidoglycan-binding domain-containing protein [Bacilli bacterium]